MAVAGGRGSTREPGARAARGASGTEKVNPDLLVARGVGRGAAERGTGLTGRRLPYRTAVLVTISTAWFAFNGGRLILPPLAVPLQEGLGIGNAGFGFAVSVLWGAYALLQFAGGVSADTVGYKTVLVASLLVIGPAFALIAVVSSYPTFLVALALVGTGGGFFYIVSRTLPAELYGPEKGRAIGIVTAAGNGAGVIAPLAATAVIAVSWRVPFAAVGGALVVIAVVVHRLVDGEYAFSRPDLVGRSRGATEEITKRGVPLLLVAYATFAVAWQGSVAFLPLYLYDTKGLSLGLANGALSVFFLTGVFVKPAAGGLSDAIPRRFVASGSILGAGLALAALALLAQGTVAVLAAVVVYGVTLLSFSPVMQAHLLEVFGERDNASSFGLARTLYVLVGSAGPTLVGVGSVTVGFTRTFATIAVLLVGASALLYHTTGRIADGSDGNGAASG